jgi:epsilon-lactone hydrolase
VTGPSQRLAGQPAPRPALRRGGHVLGAGALSAEARARLARRDGPSAPDLALPEWSDRAAVASWRAAQHAAWGEDIEPGEPEHRPIEVAGVPCLEAGPTDGPLVLYLHGGGHVLGSPGVAAPITARLADGLHVVSAGYRLAPEHPFPAALDDALAVYRALAARRPVAIAGDSAGGGIAVAAALVLAAGGDTPPAALALLSPFLDHGAGRPSALSRAYLGDCPPDDPLASPARADPAGLPPTLLQTGTGDALFAQAVAFARACRAAGVPLTLDVWDGLWHTWHYHRELPEAHQALAEVITFLEAAARGPHRAGA